MVELAELGRQPWSSWISPWVEEHYTMYGNSFIENVGGRYSDKCQVFDMIVN